ncbi:MAG: RluA family pseudouridine synthase [Actinomycetaceae bacterium]|nr:RluA family pseudouridine synthase [Actinomycetaceae bacterium]MDY6083045.1 RluA family pseudouridine synthase [Actinomycetaceae bacterium]
MGERRRYPVADSHEGDRLDAYLASLTGLSRAVAARTIDAGDVRVDGRVARKSDRVLAGQTIEAVLPDPPRVIPRAPEATIPILYDDDDVVVVNKPAGLAAHPSLNFDGPDVLGALVSMGIPVAQLGPVERHGIVHRLDVGTSGCMVVAKSSLAYSSLKDAFRYRRVEKIYHALVQGHPDPLSGTIDAPIGRAPSHQWKMGIVKGGKRAVTHYTLTEAMAGGSLLSVKLETGRTHQIRVHMAAIGHPCVGDTMYGADPRLAAALHLDRQWLHAQRLSFYHPRTQVWMTFEAPYPEDLASSLSQMRSHVVA